MKRLVQILIIALASSGLALAACDPPEDDVETAEDELEIDDELAEEEEEEEEEYDEPEFDEDMFVRAAFEMECVDQEIDDDEEAAEIQEEILARYGLTEESYEEAQQHFAEEESVELAIETRMEACDEEMARGFAEEGSGELEDGEEDAEDEEAEEADEGEEAAAAPPAPKPEPAMTGEVTASISGADFTDTTLRLEVRHDFALRGELRGTKEGRDVLVPIRGEVSEGGSISASGDRRGNSVEIDGRLFEDRAEGNLTGNIHDRDFNIRYNAN